MSPLSSHFPLFFLFSFTCPSSSSFSLIHLSFSYTLILPLATYLTHPIRPLTRSQQAELLMYPHFLSSSSLSLSLYLYPSHSSQSYPAVYFLSSAPDSIPYFAFKSHLSLPRPSMSDHIRSYQSCSPALSSMKIYSSFKQL